MKSTKNLSCNMVFFGKATHIPLRQRKPQLPPLVKVVKKCYNLDLNVYSTNLANMKAMKKKIARLNEIIGKGCMDKAQSNDKKKDESKGPQFKQGRHPSIKHGLGHTKGANTNRRRIVNGYVCVQFERKDRIGVEQPAQTMAVQHPRAAVPRPAKIGKLLILFLIRQSP